MWLGATSGMACPISLARPAGSAVEWLKQVDFLTYLGLLTMAQVLGPTDQPVTCLSQLLQRETG